MKTFLQSRHRKRTRQELIRQIKSPSRMRNCLGETSCLAKSAAFFAARTRIALATEGQIDHRLVVDLDFFS